MRFYWDPKYSVNIKSIDKQHQRFFEIVNEVNYYINAHKLDESALRKVLTELIDYAESHLKYEEEIFREIAYSETEEHCKSHNLYRVKVAEYKLRLKEPNTDILTAAREMADFARDWLSGHILAVDTKYMGEFLRADVK